MSDAPTAIGGSTGAGSGQVRSVIADAARRTGTDFQYMLAQAKIESALDPDAKARTSSAAGLYQFTRGTWLRTLEAHGDRHGLGWASAAISGGRITDPALAGPIMALRYDAQASALMAGELAGDNRDALVGVLGREPDDAELYLGHFLGSGGARRFLTALAQAPGGSAAAILPKAAAANRPIFYESSGAPRSVGAVMDLIRAKVEAANESGDPPAALIPGNRWTAMPPPADRQGGVMPSTWQQAARAPFEGRSMADTLKSTFAAHSPASQPPAAVQAAYTRLARLGL